MSEYSHDLIGASGTFDGKAAAMVYQWQLTNNRYNVKNSWKYVVT
jgi:hypothetical protein